MAKKEGFGFFKSFEYNKTGTVGKPMHQLLSLGTYNVKTFPANIDLFKVNYRNTRKRYEICSKLTIKKPERRH